MSSDHITGRLAEGRRLRDYCVLPAYRFYVYHGPVIDSLSSLIDFLHIISEEQRHHHIEGTRNDFAQWIEDVFGQKDFAAQMRSAKDIADTISILQTSIFGFAEISAMQEPVWLPAPGWDSVDSNAKKLSATFSSSSQKRNVVAENSSSPTGVRSQDAARPAGQSQFDELLDGVDPKDEKSFDSVKQKIIDRNEQLDEKYDDIVRKMMDILHDPIPKDVEHALETLKTDYDELRVKISETRKQGKDALIPSLMLKQFPPKLQLAQVTRSRDDIAKAELILRQVSFELTQAKEMKEIDVKRDVYSLAGLDENGKPIQQGTAQNATRGMP